MALSAGQDHDSLLAGDLLRELRYNGMLLSLADGGGEECGRGRAITLHHLGAVKDKIKDLKRLERTLARFVAACDGDVAPRCPVIDALSGGENLSPAEDTHASAMAAAGRSPLSNK